MFKNLSQTNVWMSLSITLLTALFYLEFSTLENSYIYLLTVFLGSNAVYHFHRLVRNVLIGESTFQTRDLWLKKHVFVLWVWVVISGGISLFLFFKQHILFTRTTAILFISVVFYATPIFRIKHKWIKLRDIPFFKVFLVALIWAMVSVYLPIELLDLEWTTKITNRFVANILLIIGITLPYDIRDIPVDESKTFANTIGELKTIRLSQFILVLWCFVESYLNESSWVVSVLVFLYAIILISKTKISSPSMHYAFYLESIPIVYFILFFLEFNIKSYF